MTALAHLKLAEAASYATLVLVVLTGLYVFVTYRLARAAVEGNRIAREAFDQQSLVATYPQLACFASHKEGCVYLIIQNAGETPAFDVDAWVFLSYSAEEDDFRMFVERHVQEKHRGDVLSTILLRLVSTDGFFCISDRMVYFTMSRKKQVEVVLSAPPGLPDSFDVFLQFRDVVGRNFYAVYWFYIGAGEAADRYRLGAVDPQDLGRWTRLEFTGFPSNEVVDPSGAELPEHFTRTVWKSAISAGRLTTEWDGVEDRGEWSDLP
jgi:hypothetical protein